MLGAGSAGLLLGLTGCPRLPRPRLTGLRDRLYVLALNRGYEEVVFTVLFVRPWATLAHRVPRRTGSWGGMAAGRGGRWF
ncbi:protein of unknown function [Candidatus Hydrogenisulfobacillus filiaventi]|uniref:Uncharacterized protein n=1 Tax=Candidatus Hydrogenisulfobacillus filiaventi TaxID=2707344 RepID=A0A6F8ZH68_9FIRM|nr:protein of unknown function [Candidatus Hydrogenisulfobacillus filiaventi]